MEAEKSKLYDIELEEVVLGAVILEREAFQKLSAEWNESIFYKPSHQTIAWAIKQLHSSNSIIDRITVSNFLKLHGKLEEIGGVYAISQLTLNVAGSSNTEYHWRLLMQMYLLRQLNSMAFDLRGESERNGADPFDIIAKYDKKLSSLVGGFVKINAEHISSINEKAIQRIEAIRDGKIQPGVYSGFESLQRHMGGWQKTDLIITAARPGMGKTALMLAFANAAASKGFPIDIYSLEQSKLQLGIRFQGLNTDNSSTNLMRANITRDEIKSLRLSTQYFSGLPIHIDDTAAISIYELRQKARRAKKERDTQFIIIDYLQLMRADGKFGNREQEISYISRELKALAKELDIPIMALSQLSREVEKRGNRIPQLSDLRESGAIEQDADEVIFIYRPEYYGLDVFDNDEPAKGMAEIIIAKNRHGAIASTRVGFEGHRMRFYCPELENKNSLQPNEDFL